MVEMTKRGEEDRRREDETVSGEPLELANPAGAGSTAVTRDKGAPPAADVPREEREGHR